MRELWDVYNAQGKKINGRAAIRGMHDLGINEYHLVVYVWIISSDNRMILSKRQKGRTFAGSWECTGGCVLMGENSLEAAVREVKEELGLELDPKNGERFKRYLRAYPIGAKAICDVWVFRQDFKESDFKLQREEVSQAKLVRPEDLKSHFRNGEFIKRYPYINRLLDKYCK